MRITAFIAFIFLSLASSQAKETLRVEETSVIPLPLSAPLDNRKMEFSGLAWCNEELWLLPQYPERFVDDGHKYFYSLSKADLIKATSSKEKPVLTPQKVRVFENEIRDTLSHLEIFEGYEAIVCEGDTAWLSIETRRHFGTQNAYIVPAIIQRDEGRVSLSIETDKVLTVPSQSGISNKGEEALVLFGDQVFTLHELADRRAVKKPVANLIHKKNGEQITKSIAPISYRITDATSPDESGKFWVSNYHYSGDKLGLDKEDPIVQKHGKGQTHESNYNVERLLELQIEKNGEITLTGRAPIQLKMESKEGRNWEGIARLDDLGFLLITDHYPGSLFAFVPYDFEPK